MRHYPPPAALQITWQSVIEQIGWKIRAADQVQLRQFLLHAAEAGPPWIATQFQEPRGRASWDVFSHRTFDRTVYQECLTGSGRIANER